MYHMVAKLLLHCACTSLWSSQTVRLKFTACLVTDIHQLALFSYS